MKRILILFLVVPLVLAGFQEDGFSWGFFVKPKPKITQKKGLKPAAKIEPAMTQPPAPAMPEKKAPAPPPAVTPAKEEAPAAKLTVPANIELVGTFITGSDKESIAIIIDKDKNEQRTYKPGDTIAGMTITKVEPGEVLLEKDGKQASLKIEQYGEAAEPSAAPKPAAQVAALSRAPTGVPPKWSMSPEFIFGSQAHPERYIRQVSENEYSIKPGFAPGFSRIFTDAIVGPGSKPRIEGGSIVGFEIIKRSSRLTEAMGLKEGDVVTKINGQPINSPDIVFQSAKKFRFESNASIQLTVNREGADIALTYSVK